MSTFWIGMLPNTLRFFLENTRIPFFVATHVLKENQPNPSKRFNMYGWVYFCAQQCGIPYPPGFINLNPHKTVVQHRMLHTGSSKHRSRWKRGKGGRKLELPPLCANEMKTKVQVKHSPNRLFPKVYEFPCPRRALFGKHVSPQYLVILASSSSSPLFLDHCAAIELSSGENQRQPMIPTHPSPHALSRYEIIESCPFPFIFLADFVWETSHVAHSAKYSFFSFFFPWKRHLSWFTLLISVGLTHTHKHFPSFRSGAEGLGKSLGLVVALSFRSF